MKRKGRIAWSIVAVLTATAGAVCALRWDAWFAQPQEAPYVAERAPHRLLLTPGSAGELSRNVSWQSDSVLRPSWLELAVDGDTTAVEAQGEVFASRAGKASYYVARLASLAPQSRYSYRVVTDGEASEWHEFSTHGLGDRAFGFVYVGDVQDTIGGQFNTYLREAFLRHPDAELLVSGGDLTERPRDADWEQTFRGLDSIGTHIPVMAVTGNHDYLKGVISKLERRFPLIFSYYLDSMVGDNQVYRLRYGNAEFFLLDSFRELPYLWTQRQWLHDALAESDATWKIVVTHHPLHSLRGKNNATQRWAFDDIIRQGGVDLVLQGHEHNYARLGDGTDGPVYIISHCSPKNYSHTRDADFDIVDLDDRYYQYIRCSEDTLSLSTYSVDGRLVDRISIGR